MWLSAALRADAGPWIDGRRCRWSRTGSAVVARIRRLEPARPQAHCDRRHRRVQRAESGEPLLLRRQHELAVLRLGDFRAGAPPDAVLVASALLKADQAQGQPDDFNLRHPTEIAEAVKQSTQTMELLLAAIASVSLLVGGIGIMNIMLVSVTERTREIGLRMAIGARGRDVRAQFLVEAVMLSLTGGALCALPK